MCLTITDLADIRNVLKEELKPIHGELEALRNDIKDMYEIISGLEHS